MLRAANFGLKDARVMMVCRLDMTDCASLRPGRGQPSQSGEMQLVA